jgi:hypothetical protein
MTTRISLGVVTLLFCNAMLAVAQSASPVTFTPGAKVFVNTMPDDFDTYLKAAFIKKKVPLVVVGSKEEAAFEMKGASETQKAGAAKKVFMLSWHSDEQASISIANLESGEVVFAYTVNKKNSAHGKQSTAEACAKHIKEVLEKKK